MKTELKFIKLMFIILAVFLITIFSNCNDEKCTDYPKGGKKYIEFHAEDSMKIPYTGTDTLKFLRTIDSTTKDTVVFIGQRKKYGVEYIRNEEQMTPCEYELYARKYEIEYIAQNISNLKFSFKHQAQETEGGDIFISFKGTEFHFLLWDWDWGNGYYEYLELNGNVYRKLREQYDYYNENNKIYYNFDYGVLRFERENEIFDIILK